MPVRMALTKATGSGEQIVIDVCQWNPVNGDIIHKDVDGMVELVDQMLAFADMRMQEMNTRMLEAYGLIEALPLQDQQRFGELMEILAGRMSADAVRRRWDAVVEENTALEEGRRQAALARNGGV